MTQQRYNDNFSDPYWEVTGNGDVEDPIGGNDGVTAYDMYNFDPDILEGDSLKYVKAKDERN